MLWELSTSGPRCSESGEFPRGKFTVSGRTVTTDRQIQTLDILTF